ncbi:MAG TPA: hypothetical protein VF789_31960 [Thermoanaerobaculia bacterium]
MENPKYEISAAVDEALQEDFPEDGLSLYLKSWVVQGYRRQVTDELILAIQGSEDSDIRFNALEIIYFLHGTPGKIIAPGMEDPRPENAQWDEPLTDKQLAALADAALAEEDRLNWDSYASFFSILAGFMTFPPAIATKIKSFAERCVTQGSENARARCMSLMRLR